MFAGAYLIRLLFDFDVQFEERFDVVRCEGDRNEAYVLLAQLCQSLDCIRGLWPLPCFGSDL